MNKNKYVSDNIEIKEGIEHVRTRPGMYIGSVGKSGLHHLIYEVVDNSIDEALEGHCTEIQVEIFKDNMIGIQDNGRGIPVDIHSKTNTSTLEVVMTKLGAGGKFNSDSYKTSGGLHGVGISVVNALSRICIAVVSRDDYIYIQYYSKGVATSEVIKVSKLNFSEIEKSSKDDSFNFLFKKESYSSNGIKPPWESKNSGTLIVFEPDSSIFEYNKFSYDDLLPRLRELSFLTPSVKISLQDSRNESKKHHILENKGGLKSYIEYLNKNSELIHNSIIYFKSVKKDVYVSCAIQYTNSYTETIYSYVNNIYTVSGGTHLSGLKLSLTRVINEYIKKMNINSKIEDRLEGSDVREGLTAVISIRHTNPQFEGQTKTKLSNSDVRGIVDSVCSEELKQYFEDYPNFTRKILEKCIKSYKIRKEIQKKRDIIRKSHIGNKLTLPGKLADCSINDPKLCELYLVEGDSAGGTAKQGRERSFQAILPLWGKMLNVERVSLDNVIDNDKIQPIISTIGTGIASEFDYSKLRYYKIIIMADADVDGSHIRTLLLTFFFRYMKKLIINRNIFIAQPPLFKITHKKKLFYAYSDAELTKILKGLPSDGVDTQRYKGLGEMNKEELWATTMDPKYRTLKRVTINDAIEAEKVFLELMGQDVLPRKEFIYNYGVDKIELDI